MVKTSSLEKELLRQVYDFFTALGNETRLQMILCLSQSVRTPTELSSMLQMSPSAISHQLTLLKNLNIVSVQRKGKNQFYALADKHIYQVLTSVVEHYKEK